MKATLYLEKCIGCGTCSSICPEIFELGDDSRAHIKGSQTGAEPIEDKEVGESRCVEEAADICPTQAIEVKK